MARIIVARSGQSYRITLAGRLSARDLKRLERACRFALEYERVPLDINLEKLSSMDDVARSYLDRLRARGALVRGDRDQIHAGGQG